MPLGVEPLLSSFRLVLGLHLGMTVTVLLFASYADRLGASSLAFDLAPGATVADMLGRVHALSRCGPFASRSLDRSQRALRAARPRAGRGRRSRDHSSSCGRLMRTKLGDEPIDTQALIAEVSRAANGARVVLFVGTMRDVNDSPAA